MLTIQVYIILHNYEEAQIMFEYDYYLIQIDEMCK